MLVNFRESTEEPGRYIIFPVDDPDIIIATVDTEEEATALLSWINK